MQARQKIKNGIPPAGGVWGGMRRGIFLSANKVETYDKKEFEVIHIAGTLT